MRVQTLVCLPLIFSMGCTPSKTTPQPAAPVSSTPPEDGAIPWAAGEAPEDLNSTIRAVPDPQLNENEMVEPQDAKTNEGIVQTEVAHICSGKATPALRSLVQVRASETRKCYDSIPPARAGAEGDLKFSIRVEKNGVVSHLEVLEDTLKVPSVADCMVQLLTVPFVEKPRGGCAVFVIPVHFTSSAEEPAP